MTERTLNIEGMTFASCAQRIEKVTKKLPGVKSSSVNLATEKMNIEFDENTISLQDIQAAVYKIGYIAVANTEKKTLVISGMTCASCAKRIEKATRKLDGVFESNVNLATEKMNIQFAPKIVSISDIIQVVSYAGYEAHEDVDRTGFIVEDRENKQREIKRQWKR